MQQSTENRLWDYRILEKIGQGEYGVVYKVRHKQTDEVYALKKINITNLTQKEKIQAFKEVKLLRKLDHKHIVRYYQSFLSADNLYIVMEYAERGDLAVAMQQRRNGNLKYKEVELWALFRILCGAVKHLHDNQIIHRDIKLENIFVMRDNTVKLGDLGLSKILESKSELTHQRVGTPIYFAPELIQHLPYSFPIDVWALGCVFYHLMNLSHPFEGATLETLAHIVLHRGPAPPKNCIYSAQLVKWIMELMDRNPVTRPDIDKVIRGIDLAELGETRNRVSVYNPKILSSIVVDQATTKDKGYEQNLYSRGEESLTVAYKRMKIRGSIKQESLTNSLIVEDSELLSPTFNHKKGQSPLAELLKNVMAKKMRELDAALSTDRRRSCDDVLPNHGEQVALEMSALRKSTCFNGHSSMIKTNGFSGQKFKIHAVGRLSVVQYPKGNKQEGNASQRGFTPQQRSINPRQRYHQIRT